MLQLQLNLLFIILKSMKKCSGASIPMYWRCLMRSYDGACLKQGTMGDYLCNEQQTTNQKTKKARFSVRVRTEQQTVLAQILDSKEPLKFKVAVAVYDGPFFKHLLGERGLNRDTN